MSPRFLPNKVAATINKMADYIRREGHVSFGQLAQYMSMRPSTLYQYVRIMRDICEDINYEHGIFSIETHHRMPDGKEVPLER